MICGDVVFLLGEEDATYARGFRSFLSKQLSKNVGTRIRVDLKITRRGPIGLYTFRHLFKFARADGIYIFPATPAGALRPSDKEQKHFTKSKRMVM